MLTLHRFHYMPKSKQVEVFAPGATHEGASRGLMEAFQSAVKLDHPDQFFYGDYNRAIITKYRATIPDGVLGIFLRKIVVDTLNRSWDQLTLMQDVAAFESSASETIDSMVDLVSLTDCRSCSTDPNVRR